jgi:Variant SH3 domain/SH3 domain
MSNFEARQNNGRVDWTPRLARFVWIALWSVVASETTFHPNVAIKEPIVKERVRAIWDYSSSAPNDLNFKSGDIIEVCGTSGAGNWWLHGWMPAKGFGLFPYNFVESLEDEFSDTEDENPVLLPLSPVEKTSTRFRVLKDISGSESDGALSLKRGDIIHLIERQSHEKWIGRVKLQTGTFVLDNSVVSMSPVTMGPSNDFGQQPIMTDRVKALFPYRTSNPEELSFVVDDCITVVGPSDDSTLWWYGTLKGRVGLFPFNFVVRL